MNEGLPLVNQGLTSCSRAPCGNTARSHGLRCSLETCQCSESPHYAGEKEGEINFFSLCGTN